MNHDPMCEGSQVLRRYGVARYHALVKYELTAGVVPTPRFTEVASVERARFNPQNEFHYDLR
jgi:hypothetical protein